MTMVRKLNGTFIKPIAERSAMPVMMPGSAIGRMTRNEIASRPKKWKRLTAAAANVPNTMAMAVAKSATSNDIVNGPQISGRAVKATRNQSRVRAGGGKVYVDS